MQPDNPVEESLEFLLAIADYNAAVDSLARTQSPVELDRFGYGVRDRRERQDRVAATKARMEELSARDYRQANPHRRPKG